MTTQIHSSDWKTFFLEACGDADHPVLKVLEDNKAYLAKSLSSSLAPLKQWRLEYLLKHTVGVFPGAKNVSPPASLKDNKEIQLLCQACGEFNFSKLPYVMELGLLKGINILWNRIKPEYRSEYLGYLKPGFSGDYEKLLNDVTVIDLKLFHVLAERDSHEYIGLTPDPSEGAIIQDGGGNTPLHTAVKANASAATITALLSKGFPINTENHEGQTAFSIAKEKGYTNLTELLRESGASQSTSRKKMLYGIIAVLAVSLIATLAYGYRNRNTEGTWPYRLIQRLTPQKSPIIQGEVP